MTGILRLGKQIAILVIALCIAGAVLMLKVDASHSRHRSGAISLADKEEAALREDLSSILALLDPSSKTRFRAEPSPKTDAGREIVALIKNDAEVEAALKSGIRGLSVNVIVAPSRLSTETGRQQSNLELKRYRQVMETYYHDKLAVRDGLTHFMKRLSKQPPANIVTENHLLVKLDSKLQAVNRIAKEMIDFTARTKPRLSEDKRSLVFRAQDLPAFNRLSDRLFNSMESYMASYRAYKVEADEAAKNLADQLAHLGNPSS